MHRYLRLELSPEQVSGRLRLEGVLTISHECIYQHIYDDKRKGGELIKHLRCQKVRRKRYGSGQERRGTLKDRLCIEQRPAIVDARSRMGDWEGDTVVGKGHQGVLVTLVERKSRYTLAQQLDSRHSAGVTEAVIALLRPHKHLCETITFDNGKEFAEHAFIAASLGAMCTSRIPTTHGSVGSTRTPMACCASTSPSAPTCAGSRSTKLTMRSTGSTTDPASASTTALPTRCSWAWRFVRYTEIRCTL
ncbi:integrase catalytic subunit [Acidovorax sp. NO-1]|nr:integrase catalytic subunit [Acidovorax sp. NO-1]